ncbi:MAG: TssQ family T6SS-associated lipoprotein [Burkholderiales bacterium]|nr:TssQ family T6SS-associated lipoprotein [Burkholderiales bacterium]
MNSTRMRRAAASSVLVAALVCAGCATQPTPETAPETKPPPAPVAVIPPPPAPPPVVVPPPVTAQSELANGVKSYEDGDYTAAAKYFQSALDMGLATPADIARAHKYRAFLVCVNGREKACREEFHQALEADPSFELAPAEASHPIWSQVLRSVKAEIAAAAKKAKTKKAPLKPAARPATQPSSVPAPKSTAAPATKVTTQPVTK